MCHGRRISGPGSKIMPPSAWTAALVLSVLMAAAIIEFGTIDATGYIIPIALLIAIGIDPSRFPALRHTLAPFC